MEIVSIGGGPAGLYLALLMKKADPGHRIRVLERNRPDDTFGFGVVFSDATLEGFREADEKSYREITRHFAHWDDIEIHVRGQVHTSTGHGFSGLARKTLLQILHRRAEELGVELHFQHEVGDFDAIKRGADLVLGADGVNSAVRAHWAKAFQPSIDWRPNRFVWLGTSKPFGAFTFYFKEDDAGLWRVHAYRYEEGSSTFILECTEETWKKSGMERASEAETVTYAERLFAEELDGHRLVANRSLWRQFPTIRCRNWSHENVVLMGDAVHTAHFSIGSGTKLAMEDAIDLHGALVRHRDQREALLAYQEARKSTVDSIQRAAQVSMEWFENTERYLPLDPLQFSFSLLTRSLRITHENLKKRDPEFVNAVDRLVAERSARESGLPSPEPTPPPIFNRFRLRGLELDNRVVVSPMCQYSAEDGTVNDWHLVHLGSRALGGAGLVIAEMTDVSADGRISPGCAGMYRPEHVPAWRRITDFVHRYSRAKIGLQLAHAGRKGSTRVLWEGEDLPLEQGNWPLIAASAIAYKPGSQVPKAMDEADLARVKADFVRSAELAEGAGFDLLELHMAHGYLLASFLSPLTNRRADAYGGSLENRMRYPLEVFRAVRAVWPAHKPMSVRISATDWAPDGATVEDAVALAQALREAGVDIVDVSSGQTDPASRPVYGRLYQTPFAERIKQEVGLPVMTVGNISSFEDANSIVAAGRADLCVLARAHLYDPYWTRHAAQELGYPVEWPDQYKSLTRYTPRFKS